MTTRQHQIGSCHQSCDITIESHCKVKYRRASLIRSVFPRQFSLEMAASVTHRPGAYLHDGMWGACPSIISIIEYFCFSAHFAVRKYLFWPVWLINTCNLVEKNSNFHPDYIMVSCDLPAFVDSHVDPLGPCAPPNDDATFAASSESREPQNA